MVAVLGHGDGILRVVEKQLPSLDIHARGNEITVSGPPQDVELVRSLFDEILIVLRTGATLSEDSVRRSITLLQAAGRGEESLRPAEVLTLNILSNRGPHHPAEDAEPEALRGRDRRAHRSSSASARRAPARPTWRWRRPSRRCRPRRSTGSS